MTPLVLDLDELELERRNSLDDTVVGPPWEPAPVTVRPRDADGYAELIQRTANVETEI